MTLPRAALVTIAIAFFACAKSEPIPSVREFAMAEILSVRTVAMGLDSRGGPVVLRATCSSSEEYALLVDTRGSGSPEFTVQYVDLPESMVVLEPGSPAVRSIRQRLATYLDRNVVRDRSGTIISLSEPASDMGEDLGDARSIDRILVTQFADEIAELLGLDGQRFLSCTLLGNSDTGSCELIMSEGEIRKINQDFDLEEWESRSDMCDALAIDTLPTFGQPMFRSLNTSIFDCIVVTYDPTEGWAEVRAVYREEAD